VFAPQSQYNPAGRLVNALARLRSKPGMMEHVTGWAILLALSVGAAGPMLRFWERLPTGRLPAEALGVVCGDEQCRARVVRAPVWRADLNGDGKHEYLVADCGQGGCRLDVVTPAAAGWKSIFEPRRGALLAATPAPGEIFPRARNGYRDFRVSDLAFKWNGSAYLLYQAADYHAIERGWLDELDPASAVLLWLRDYAGKKEFDLAPRYLPGAFGALPQAALAGRVSDPKTGTEWISFLKGNVWADLPKQERRFFVWPPLGPSPPQLKLVGEWLIAYSEGQEAARIHRRSLHVRLIKPLGE